MQRQMILHVLEEAEGHLTMDQLAERVQSTYPSVSLSTIYRNVDLLIDRGLLRANHLSVEGTTYELADSKPHVHLVCQHCHSVTHLDAIQLDPLQADLQTAAQFHVVSLVMTVTGHCTPCWEQLLSEDRSKEETTHPQDTHKSTDI